MLFMYQDVESARRWQHAPSRRSAAAGKNGTLQPFLARQQRQNRGLQPLTIFARQGTIVGRAVRQSS
jgi:hypothetical protein